MTRTECIDIVCKAMPWATREYVDSIVKPTTPDGNEWRIQDAKFDVPSSHAFNMREMVAAGVGILNVHTTGTVIGFFDNIMGYVGFVEFTPEPLCADSREGDLVVTCECGKVRPAERPHGWHDPERRRLDS